MATNPFDQLDVIRKVSARDKPVYDCYRLLYHKTLWLKVWEQNNGDKPGKKTLDLIDQIIVSLRKNSFDFAKLAQPTTVQMAVNVVYEILSAVFCIKLKKYDDRDQILIEIKRTWHSVKWVIVGQYPSFDLICYRKYLLAFIKQTIVDDRFMQLINQVISDKRVIHQQIFCHLMRQIFYHAITDSLSKSISPFTNETKFKPYKTECLIGFSSNKQDATTAFKKIESIMSDLVTPYLPLKPISQPTLFVDYHITQNSAFSKPLSLQIPYFKLKQFAIQHHYGNMDKKEIRVRKKLLNLSEREIVRVYQRELVELFQRYHFADNKHLFNKLVHLAKGSLIRTIAAKRKISIKAATKYITKTNLVQNTVFTK